jgi:YbgC/YbaW family acyl-CoA thioester hydrolase
MAVYEADIKVRFGDIDHAGIVYFPRISHYCHVALEEYYQHRVGLPYHELLDRRRLGFPIVRAEMNFRRTFAFGDTARVEITTARVGRTSLTMLYRLRKIGGEQYCTEAEITTVCVDMDTFQPVPIPDDLRAVFEATR